MYALTNRIQTVTFTSCSTTKILTLRKDAADPNDYLFEKLFEKVFSLSFAPRCATVRGGGAYSGVATERATRVVSCTQVCQTTSLPPSPFSLKRTIDNSCSSFPPKVWCSCPFFGFDGTSSSEPADTCFAAIFDPLRGTSYCRCRR